MTASVTANSQSRTLPSENRKSGISIGGISFRAKPAASSPTGTPLIKEIFGGPTIHRRSVLATAVASGNLLFTEPARSNARARTFVLVHGAYHGGWCWADVAKRLTALGHRVYAPSLTGLADRSHLLDERVNLSTHVDDILNLMRWEDLSDVTLCGHSYAGMVVTSVADRAPERIRRLVVLDGWIAVDGLSALELGAMPAKGAGIASAPPDASFFIHDPQKARWAQPKLTPQPNACSTEKARITGAYNHVPERRYVLITKSVEGFVAASNRARDQGWKVIPAVGSHDLMVDDPKQTVDLLLGA